jgi:hypothetical protein
MATRMQQRRGTAAQWTSADPILETGEIGFEIDTNKFKIGDGVNHWDDLIYYASAADLAALVDNAPALLNTLNELAAAIGDDPSFITSIGEDIQNAVAISNGYTDNAIDNNVPGMIANALAEHNLDTTNVHGIANTAALATVFYVDSEITSVEGYINGSISNANVYSDNAISTHSADTTSIHGISDTSNLVYQTDLSSHASDTTNIHGIANTAVLVTLDGTEILSNKTLADPTFQVLVDGLPVTISSTELLYLDTVSSNIQTQLNAKATPSDIADHNSDTSNVHGIADTSKIVMMDAASVTLDGNLVVDGDFTVNGNNFAASATSITIEDNLLQLAHQNAVNTVDLGLVVGYTESSTAKHSGIVRDVSTDKWKLFKGVTTEPATTVDFTQGSLDDLELNNITAAGVVFTDGTQTKEGVPSRTAIISKTANYTLSATSERDSLIEVNSTDPVTITIPTNSAVAYPTGTTLDILGINTGLITIAGSAGVTVNATPGLKLRTQWSSCTLLKRGENSWVVYGDLKA